jgi:hypothetical protein
MTDGAALTAPGAGTDQPAALEPTRDLRATLPDLLDALLDKGVYLDLDLIITVADIPLIGVNLRAMIAGMETMLEHGMMRAWDEQTREWVRRSLARRVPLDDDEDVVARMAGGHRQEEPAVWRPGTVYLTTRRIMVWRNDPRELLWQARLDEITGAALKTEQSIGGEDRSRLTVTTAAGTTVLSAAAPERLEALLQEQVAEAKGSGTGERPAPLLEGPLWYLEGLAGGSVWRGGSGVLDSAGNLTWKGVRDSRPALRLTPGQILSVDVVPGRTPLGRESIVVDDGTRAVRLATDDTARWATALTEVASRRTLPRTGGAP